MSLLTGPSHPPRTGSKPGRIVVLLHGLGADGRDLIQLAPELARHLPDAVFYAPDAPEPCDMAPVGRQWFSLRDMRPETLARGAERAAPLLDRYLDHLLARHDLEPQRLGLVGFSQGAMMALHVGLRRTARLGAVAAYSGALVAPERLAAELKSRPPVLLVHGDADEVVPAELMFAALEALQRAEVPVQWLLRQGLGHGIDPVGLDAGGRFLRDFLA